MAIMLSASFLSSLDRFEEPDIFPFRVNESGDSKLTVFDFHLHWGENLGGTQADRLVKV